MVNDAEVRQHDADHQGTDEISADHSSLPGFIAEYAYASGVQAEKPICLLFQCLKLERRRREVNSEGGKSGRFSPQINTDFTEANEGNKVVGRGGERAGSCLAESWGWPQKGAKMHKEKGLLCPKAGYNSGAAEHGWRRVQAETSGAERWEKASTLSQQKAIGP